MNTRPQTRPPADRPWWLEGDEQCGYCLQWYVYEHRIHCRRCDEPMCPECLETTVRVHEWVCPTCHRKLQET